MVDTRKRLSYIIRNINTARAKNKNSKVKELLDQALGQVIEEYNSRTKKDVSSNRGATYLPGD